SAAAQLAEQATQTFQSASTLCLFLETAEDRRRQRCRTASRLVLADAQLPGNGAQAAHLGKKIIDLHGRLLSAWLSGWAATLHAIPRGGVHTGQDRRDVRRNAQPAFTWRGHARCAPALIESAP